MTDPLPIYLAKVEESLRGAESEFAQGLYNNAANRCYDACFQAAWLPCTMPAWRCVAAGVIGGMPLFKQSLSGG
jgi:hypothetical protein